MTQYATVGKTGISYIDSLLSGTKWDVSILTFSFPSDASFYGENYSPLKENEYGFLPMTVEMQEWIRAAFKMISDVCGLTFVEVTETDTLHADLRFGFTEAENTSYPGAVAWSRYPSSVAAAGDVWFDAQSIQRYSDVKTAFSTIMHEIGHALGLKHAHEAYGSFPVAEDQYRFVDFTVMDYYGYGIGVSDGGPQTFQRGDIAALQALYGANFNTNSGNTTYKVYADGSMTIQDGSNPAVILADGSRPLYRTIWDGNGTDVYDFSALSEDQTIDLRPGEGSAVLSEDRFSLNYITGRMSFNIYNAFQYNDDPRSLIENVYAGNGNNTIYGNAANNFIKGGNKMDVIYGGDGSDNLWGDTSEYSGGDDIIYGGAGNDYIYGKRGNDVLYGGDGDDIIEGDQNNSYRTAGNDYLDGGNGNDTLSPGLGVDIVIGGDGIDRVNYAYAAHTGTGVHVSLLDGRGYAGAATGDTYYGIENVTGSDSDDIVVGDHGANSLNGHYGNDRLEGLDGDDILVGDLGDDILIGGRGNDTLQGSAGNDTFIFGFDFGLDTIWDFAAGAGLGDVISFEWLYFLDFQSVLNAASQVGINTVITCNMNTTITLRNVQLSSLHEDDFSFMAIDQIIYGTDGRDILYGGVGNDILYGGADYDDLYGGDGNDFLYGGTGLSGLHGGAGDDYMDASEGWAVFTPGTGMDILIGGKMTDTVSYYDEGSGGGVHISLLDGRGYGGAANGDIYVSIENVEGTNSYNDILIGDNNNNELRGYKGDDYLEGNGGKDFLTGGLGNDTFIFAANFGKDIITDFVAGSGIGDVIDFAVDVFQDFQSVLNAATQVGTDTVIAYDVDNTVTLRNVQLSNLHEDDFSFFA